MIIRTETTISFHVPDEYEAHERFKANNDMGLWKEQHTSQFWSYTTKQVQEAREQE